MAAFNVVRFRVKPGAERQFIELHQKIRPAFKGFLGGDLIRTGEQTFCMVGQWRNMKALEAARPEMIGVLDQLRDMLEDLGGDLGVTDPVSGDVVASIRLKAKAKKKSGKTGGRKDKGKAKDASRKKKKSKGKDKGKRKGKGK